ncbi:MAG TPA: asparagine synthase (glutamine-hydrolyzing) [Acetobacteraceae bacterium]|nr:asparagine synthase (glutamine-hydrolyzing) [Acetobacteraceae bacterium]
MCGIAGIFTADREARPSLALARRMTDAIAHRGPDGEGFFTDPGLVLGHRRLAVIDPEGGHQPMFNEDGSVAIVFNGEIYNFEALRRELARLGHNFRNRCDTEAIVHAWESWGPDCVTRLAGMFAFALWDRNSETLFCARDRLGKKPFHYASAGGDFYFGSELAALAQVPGLLGRLDPAAIEDFFTFGYVPEPASIFAGVAKLPAAHTLLLRRGAPPRLTRYWSPPTVAQPCVEADAILQLQTLLRDAVGKRLVADVPLGAFLSGGVDSSAVVATAAAQRASLDTFTVGFEGAEDETRYARTVAARYATRQHETREAALDMIEGARRAAAVFGEPFGDPSAVPTIAVCRMARRHVTVALSGDGGDEVFAGYRRTRWHTLVSAARRYLPRTIRRHVVGQLATLYPKLDRAPRFLRGKYTLSELSLDDAAGFARTATKIHETHRRALFSATQRAAIAGHDPHAALVARFDAAEDADPLLQAQLADLATWLPGDILVKADRASMAASLELRAPFLDHALVEWGLALPSKLKLHGTEGKYVLKKALEPALPPDILYRPKQGFTNDLAPAFRSQAPKLRTRLLGEPMLSSGLFAPAAVARLIDEHEAGGADHSQKLWLLLSFEGFLAAREGLVRPSAHAA